MNLQRVSNMQQHTCKRCERTFNCASALAKHLVSRPSQCRRPRHICVKCKNPYASKQSPLANHKKICNGSTAKMCDKCEKVFTSHQALTSHKRWKCNFKIDQKQPVSATGINKQQAAADVASSDPSTLKTTQNKIQS